MDDVLLFIFNLLPITDIVSCLHVNKMFNKICNSSQLWKSLLSRDFIFNKYHKNNYYNAYIVYFKLSKMQKLIKYDISFEKLYYSSELELVCDIGDLIIKNSK